MPRKSPRRGVTPEDLYALQLVEDPQLSPDGRYIAFVKATIDKVANQYRRHIWLVALDGAAPRPRQFTRGPKSDTSPRWSPDGRTLAFVSARGEHAQIFLIGLDGGEARPLTNMPRGARHPVWSPDGRQLAFLAPVNAEERQREAAAAPPEPPPADSLEARHRQERAAEAERLKADPRVVTRLPYRTGTEFLDDRAAHIYVVDVPPDDAPEPPRPRRITDGEWGYESLAWAADGAALFSTLSRDPANDPWFYHDLIRLPLRGRRPRGTYQRLTQAGHEYSQPCPSPDGRWLAALRRPETGNFGRHWRLVLLPAARAPRRSRRASTSLGPEQVLAASLDRQITDVQWSPDSRSLYFLAGDHGRVGVYRVDLEAPEVVEHVVAGERSLTGYSLDRASGLAFAAWTPARPADLYHLPAAGPRRPARAARPAERRLTDFNHKLLAELQLSEPEALRYAAPDGREIQGWLFPPLGQARGQKVPLVVHMHGGPHIMWGPSFPGMWLEWHHHTANGYAVFFCNPRGADGYGEGFAALIHNDWGDHVMHDILAGVEHVLARGFVDPRRLALTGGSYAGYMTAWIVSHDHRFACAWAQRGLYSLLSFFGTSDIPQLIEREFDMFPFDDVEKSWRQSPLAYVRDIRTPLAIEHQEQDYRCPISEAEQLFAALKRLKREVVFYRYPREGHEMSRAGEPRHRVDRLERMLAWFQRFCGA